MWRIRDSEGIREWVVVVVIGKQGQVAGSTLYSNSSSIVSYFSTLLVVLVL